MDFIYKLFPPQGIFADAGGQFLMSVAIIIGWIVTGLIIIYWLVKAVLKWLFKSRSTGFRGKRTGEQEVLATLTAKPVERNKGFIQGSCETFTTFEGKDFGRSRQEIIRKYFDTGIHAAETCDWDYGHNERYKNVKSL